MIGRAIVLRGDAAHLPLPDDSVDLIVTSPPYWSLRDYRDGGESLAGQIGSEATWQEYLANLLECTREWVRVLKPEGSIFVNIGDKYANDAKWGGATSGKHVEGLHGKTGIGRAKANTGIPAKSLIGLPARYALACLDELGLIWRRDNIWHKISALPESVEDRCATRHEYIHHLTTQPRYFAAVDEIREPSQADAHTLTRRSRKDSRLSAANGGQTSAVNSLGKLPGSVWEIAAAPLYVPEHIEHGRCCGGRKHPGCEDGLDHHAAFPPALAAKAILGWSPSGICLECDEGRRPVVEGGRRGDGSKPHKAALRVASFDWAAWRESEPHRIVGYACACTPFTDHPGTGKPTRRRDYNPAPNGAHPQGTYGRKQAGEYERVGPWREYHLEDWTAPPTRPALVVDPFGGTGTTALVASVLGRTGITIDRSADYCRLAQWRTTDPAERARALGAPKPPPVSDGQGSLFDELAG